jgi:N-acetylglucosaminyl-diphospho-decaprenol L-rhamnosyltransferase
MLPREVPIGCLPTLDVILVNWNAGDQLRRCLATIPSHPEGFHLNRVVVVDNGSSDGSITALDGLGLPLTILANTENRGFAAACNQGAAGSGATYLLFLNPDTRLEGDSLSTPLAFMEQSAHAEVGVCGIRLVDDDGMAGRSCTRFPTPAHFVSKMLGLDRLSPRRFPTHFMEEWDHSDSRDVDHVMGAFYLIRGGLFQQVGGFDERFFVYLEDLDLSLRVHQAGYRIHYLAEARAFHKGGGSSEQVKARRLFYSLRSRILYGFKHFHWGTAMLLMGGTLLLEPWSRLALAAARRSPSAAMETLGGFAALWRAWPPWKWKMVNR